MNMDEAWRRAWQEPDRRPVYEWAAEHIRLPPSYTITGQFHVELSRHLIAPLDALHDDAVRSVTVIAPPRSGKSLLADVWIPSVVARDPGPVMWNFQTDRIAKDYAEERIQPVLRACPALRPLWPLDRHKASAQRLIFNHGVHLYIQGPSVSNLQTKGIRYQVNDEAWLWKPGRLKEALARLEDFRRLGTSKALIVSQAGTEGDALEAQYRSGSMSEWTVPCLHCGAHQRLDVWTPQRPDGSRWGLRYDAPARERGDTRGDLQSLGAILPTVRFECRDCGQVMTDSGRTRSEWNRLGRYLDTNGSPEAGARSFRWSALITYSWADLVTEWLHAMDAWNRGAIEPLVEFVQKKVPDFWSEQRLLRTDPMARVDYDVKAAWEEETCRIFTVDRQAEGLHWGLIHSWSKAGETRRLWFGQLYSEAEVAAKAEEFKVKPRHVLIDSGYEARMVYAMCARHGWIALKGDAAEFFLHTIRKPCRTPVTVRRSTAVPTRGDPEMGTGSQGARFAYLIRWSNPAIKTRLKRLIEGRGGRWILPASTDAAQEEEYQRQMRAEYAVTRVDAVTGRRRRVWVCPSGNNHLFDCAAMQVVAATLLGILGDEVEGDTRPAAEKVVEGG